MGDPREAIDTRNQGHGSVKIGNPHLRTMDTDFLYHLELSKQQDLKEMFGDVKYLLVGGTNVRMKTHAEYFATVIGVKLPTGHQFCDISRAGHRYAMYKVGPILLLSHGIGMPSFSVMMNEVIKLLHYAEAKDVCAFRLGTCGGLGVPAGTVVVTSAALNARLEPTFEMTVLGQTVRRPAEVSQELSQSVMECHESTDGFKVEFGKTMCADCFYEGQGRLDGAFCDYTEEDKMKYLQYIHGKGVRNIEMESLCFAAMCHKANIQGAVVCVAILNRLESDQVTANKDEMRLWDERPALLVARLIKQRLALDAF